MATPETRSFSPYASDEAKAALQNLLKTDVNPEEYRAAMRLLGTILGGIISPLIPHLARCLVVSTAEDADYLSRGVLDGLKSCHITRTAVFWNNHYSIGDNVSVAPVVHKFLEPGYEKSSQLVVVKSIISGSCVVRTNLLEVIEQVKAQTIYIVSPVMHKNSEASLKSEFPAKISKKFKFVYFAQDTQKEKSSGEVVPGIGGQVYGKLGLDDQPVRSGFIPELVKELTHMY